MAHELDSSTRLEEIKPRTGNYFEVPAGGAIRGIVIRFNEPILHVNAAGKLGFIFEQIIGHFSDFQVFVERSMFKES